MAEEKRNIDDQPSAPPAYTPANNSSPYPQGGYPQSGYAQPGYPQASYPQGQNGPNVTLQSTGVTVVGSCMGFAQRQPLANPPPDYMVWSIISTIFCCFWIGIAAVLKSREVRTHTMLGNEAGAAEASRQAKLYNIISDVLGFVFLGAYIGGLVYYIHYRVTCYGYYYC